MSAKEGRPTVGAESFRGVAGDPSHGRGLSDLGTQMRLLNRLSTKKTAASHEGARGFADLALRFFLLVVSRMATRSLPGP